MSSKKFQEIRRDLMQRLDLTRELSDQEILEMIDQVILNDLREDFPCRRRWNFDRDCSTLSGS